MRPICSHYLCYCYVENYEKSLLNKPVPRDKTNQTHGSTRIVEWQRLVVSCTTVNTDKLPPTCVREDCQPAGSSSKCFLSSQSHVCSHSCSPRSAPTAVRSSSVLLLILLGSLAPPSPLHPASVQHFTACWVTALLM